MKETRQEFASDEFGAVVFVDRRETISSALAHPRDINIVKGPDRDSLRAEIAIDIRRGQGAADIGIAQNLKY